MNGIEATIEIKKILNKNNITTIVGCTAYQDNKTTASCFQAGMSFVFYKPLNIEKIKDFVFSNLDASKI